MAPASTDRDAAAASSPILVFSYAPNKNSKAITAISPEKQFKRTYAAADGMKGDTSENLIGLLERRLDAVVYRSKFVPTVFSARQFVSHGHIKVNGIRVNIPSYRCKEGDVIEIREKSRDLAIVIEAAGSPERDIPDYLDVDHGKLKSTFVRTPELAEVPYPVVMEPNLVVEFYSR